MMRVSVDAERCQGHGRCTLLCPEVFDVDDEGHALVIQTEVPEDLRAGVERAVANCPENAISLEGAAD
jgi:ferredoxin